jgi:cobalt-zinc-cadmium efflux system outer membrane protein
MEAQPIRVEESMKIVCAAAVGAMLAATSSPRWAGAEEALTLESALRLARERSPAILAARGRRAEAEARLNVRPPLRDNPVVSAAGGSREGADTGDLELSVSQTLELGGRGGARRAMDEASLAREAAEAAEAERGVLREVRAVFLRGLHAAERLRLARSQEADAARLHEIAHRRHDSGEVAALDVNVAASTLARTRAEVRAGEAAQRVAEGELRALLDIASAEPLALAGSLAPDAPYDAAPPSDALSLRPEIRSLEAQLQEADAEVRLGRGLAWPEVTPAVRYERDEGDQVWWAGLSITLPAFDRGQQLRATGEARAARLRAELEARRRALRIRFDTALAVHDLRADAVRELARNADRLADNEALARRGYEVGQIGLAELLVVRRETADARRQWLDSLLDLAQARADVDSLGGSR